MSGFIKTSGGGGAQWRDNGTLPYAFYDGSAVVLNDEIHILGGSGTASSGHQTNHYKYSNNQWISASTLPYWFSGTTAVVLNDEIHILGSNDSHDSPEKKHYKYSNGQWTSVSTLPFKTSFTSAVVLNGEIHILGSQSSSDQQKHYKYSNGRWTSVSTLPYGFRSGSAVVLNDEIHILGGGSGRTNHYKYFNGQWTSVSTLPYDFYYGSAVVLNGEIHILGGYVSGNYTKHYKYSNGQWVSVNTLPYDFYAGSAVVLNDEIHILGGYTADVRTNHFYYDGIPNSIKKIERAIISVPDGYATDNGVTIKKYANKNVINAWIGTQNGNKLALSSTYSRSSHLNLPGGFLLAPFFVAEYKGKIYMLVDQKYNDNPITLPAFLAYNDDTQNWTQLTAPPIEHGHIGAATPNTAFMVVYNDKLHFIMPWWPKHYCWDGTSWQEITMPVTYYQYGRAYEGWFRCIVFKPEGENEEKIYLLNVADMSSGGSISEAPCGYVCYTDTDGWSSDVYTYPYEDVDIHFITASRENYPVMTTYKGEIHVLGCGEDGKYHYSWDGTNQGKWHNWSDDPLWPLADSMPYDSRGLMAAISINDCIYCIGGDSVVASAISEEHMKLVYSWNPDREMSINGMKGWHREEDLPYIARGGYYIYGGAVIHKNGIYILSIDGEVNTGLSINPTIMILNPLRYFD